MKLILKALDDARQTVYEFAGPTITMGRDRGCDLPLPGTSNVSSRHAQIALSEEGAVLSDLQSTNGTYLNDRRLEADKKLRKGDCLRLGQAGPSFQIVELDFTSAAPTTREESSPFAKTTVYPDLGTPIVPVQPARVRPATPAYAQTQPDGGQGKARLMVLALQQSNRNLVLALALAVVSLLVLGGIGTVYFFYKTKDLSTQTTELSDTTKNLQGQTADLGDATKKLQQNKAPQKTDVVKFTPISTPAPLTGEQISDRLRRSTTLITSPLGTGSGVLINAEDKIVVTNYHVVAEPKLKRLVKDMTREMTNDDFNKDIKRLYQEVPLKLPATLIHIEQASAEFPCRLTVYDARGKELKLLLASDDSEPGFNARVRFLAPFEGDYLILAESRDGGLGKFTVSVSAIEQAVYPSVMVNFPVYADGKLIADKEYYRNLHTTAADRHKAEVIDMSPEKDLAILKLNHVPPGLKAVPLAKESARSGQQLYSVGNPGTSRTLWTYTDGKVRSPEAFKAKYLISTPALFFFVDAWVIETQAPINPGDSGGPVVNERGELVAVTQGFRADANTISSFIDVREVRAMLKKNNIAWEK